MVISMTTTEMKNNIVNTFGLEHENTIKFFRICQYRYSKLIPLTYKKMMAEAEKEREED